MSYKKYSKMLKKAIGPPEEGMGDRLILDIIDKSNSIEEIKQKTREKIEEIGRHDAEPLTLTEGGEPLDNHEIAGWLEDFLNPRTMAIYIEIDLNMKFDDITRDITQIKIPTSNITPDDYWETIYSPFEFAFGKHYHLFADQLKSLNPEKAWQIRGEILTQPEKFIKNLMEKAKKDLDNDL